MFIDCFMIVLKIISHEREVKNQKTKVRKGVLLPPILLYLPHKKE